MNEIIIFCAKYLVLVVLLGAGFALLQVNRKAKIQFIVSTLLAGAIAFVLARMLSQFIYDPRPFVELGVKPLIDHAADNGFPSDHALFTMTLTAITFFFSRKIAYVMFGFTVVIGAARVASLVHSSTDIFGAWAVGIAAAIISYFIVRWLFNRGADSPANSKAAADHATTDQ